MAACHSLVKITTDADVYGCFAYRQMMAAVAVILQRRKNEDVIFRRIVLK
jgi:hypothetical protein